MLTCYPAQVNWLLWLALIAIGVNASLARGEALFVRGAVTGEWTAPIDTVVIDSFAWVPQAETLQIAPGMVVAFSGRFSLVVNGTLERCRFVNNKTITSGGVVMVENGVGKVRFA